MTTSPLIFYSTSGVSTDWNCPRKRYYGSEYAGVGLSGETTSIYLFIGQALHDGLAAIAAGVDIDTLAEAANAQIKAGLLSGEYITPEEEFYAAEQACLVEGLLRGFHKHVWPKFMESYKVVHTEKEMLYRYGSAKSADGKGDLAFMAKPDLLVEDREGNVWYVEYKSTGKSDEKWTNSWATAVQLHSAVRAAEQMLGIKVTGVIVQGLYKGYVYKGQQGSPFCYGYFKHGEPPFTEDKWSHTYKPGFKKAPIWLRPGGVKQWIEEMPENVLAEQFPQVPPIFIDDSLVDSFFEQRDFREHEIAAASKALQNPDLTDENRKMILDMTFPQRFDQCSPSFGTGCTFKKLCFSPLADRPLEAGYVLRDNSHRDGFYKLVDNEG